LKLVLKYRAVGSSENSAVQVVIWWAQSALLVEIGLTDLPKGTPGSDRPEIYGVYPREIEFSKTVRSIRARLLIHTNVLFHRPLMENLNKIVCFMTMTA
jgi:hypothetical protein